MTKRKDNSKANAGSRKQSVMKEISSWAAILVIALFIMTFNLQTFGIPSSSMENTLLVGDHLIVDRITPSPKTSWALWEHYREIHRGDVIVFYSPATPGMHLVKRVIGAPGDRIHLRDGVVYLNGVEQKEPYVIHRQDDYEPYRDNFPAVPAWQSPELVTPAWRQKLQTAKQGDDVVVPPHCYFAMGDNRDVSWDSRYWGFVSEASIIGRPLLVYWSFEEAADPNANFREQAKYILHATLHFFDETRWRRTFHLVH
jgi:signal peptidase I